MFEYYLMIVPYMFCLFVIVKVIMAFYPLRYGGIRYNFTSIILVGIDYIIVSPDICRSQPTRITA